MFASSWSLFSLQTVSVLCSLRCNQGCWFHLLSPRAYANLGTYCYWNFLIQNAQHFESNTALCKVSTNDTSYIVRCSFLLSCSLSMVFHLIMLLCLYTYSSCSKLKALVNSDRCCVKGSLLEVNDRLIKQPDLLNSLVRITWYICL